MQTAPRIVKPDLVKMLFENLCYLNVLNEFKILVENLDVSLDFR